eukprot:5654593-Pyramimonas_sp.AAC.1
MPANQAAPARAKTERPTKPAAPACARTERPTKRQASGQNEWGMGATAGVQSMPERVLARVHNINKSIMEPN